MAYDTFGTSFSLPQPRFQTVLPSTSRCLLDEWASNAADIDAAKVVWARDIPGRDLRPLLDYYRDRKLWVVDADAAHPQLEPYSGDGVAQGLH